MNLPAPGAHRSRRSCLLSLASAVSAPGLWLGSPAQAHAGSQLEEPLMDSVRSALSSAISNQSPPVPEFKDTESKMAYLRWMCAMSERLKKKLLDLQI